MKTSNKHDNRFTKDVLLHQIFQEISDENRKSPHDTHIDDLVPDPNTKLSNSRKVLKKREWFFIVFFMIGIIYLWFNIVTEPTQPDEDRTKNDIYTTSKTDQIVQKKEDTRLPDVLKEKSKNHLVIEETDNIQIVQESSPEVEDPKTEREKAKEALLIQMQ